MNRLKNRFIKVKVITGACENRIKHEGDKFRVYTTASPEKNRANKSVIAILAKFFNKRPRDFLITCGKHSREKTFQIIS
ncbi:MAG: DUF167 domain-containing protein [Candidatus Omnitrophica bacterium]|nr:DUF167 domain-containing protein [Candidatus Omnitrophota bacterium]